MLSVGLAHYMLLSVFLLVCGATTLVLKRSAVGMLMGVELILSAAALNFVAMGHYRGPQIDGQIAALFVIVIAAAEAAVALAIFLHFYVRHATVNPDDGTELRG